MVYTSSFFVESKREFLLLVNPAPLHELRTLQSLDQQLLTTATTLGLFPYSLAPQEKWKGYLGRRQDWEQKDHEKDTQAAQAISQTSGTPKVS
jgi:hypothetical protein